MLEYLLDGVVAGGEGDGGAVVPETKARKDADELLKGCVRSLRDVVEVRFAVAAGAGADAAADRDAGAGARSGGEKGEGDPSAVTAAGEKRRAARAAWVCPITGETLGPGPDALGIGDGGGGGSSGSGGVNKAVYIVPCGHAFSEAVIREVAETRCLQVRLKSGRLTLQGHSNRRYKADQRSAMNRLRITMSYPSYQFRRRTSPV